MSGRLQRAGCEKAQVGLSYSRRNPVLHEAGGQERGLTEKEKG